MSNVRRPDPDIDETAGTFDHRAGRYFMRWPAPTPPAEVKVQRIVMPEDPETRYRQGGPQQQVHVWEYEVSCPVCPSGAPPIRLAWQEVVPMDAVGYARAEGARAYHEQQRRHEAEVARLTAALEAANRERAALRSRVVKQDHRRSKRTRGY